MTILELFAGAIFAGAIGGVSVGFTVGFLTGVKHAWRLIP